MKFWKFGEGQKPLKSGILIVLASALLLSYSPFAFYSFNKVDDTSLSVRSDNWAHVLQKSLQTRALDDIKEKDIKRIDCYLHDILKSPQEYKVVNFCPSPRWPTAVWRRFGRTAFKIGTVNEGNSVVGLSGCTVVVIWTRQGVWMAHFWEVPGFSKSPTPSEGEEMDFKTDRFQQDVLDFIKNGIATKSPDEKAPLRGDKLGNYKAELENCEIWILAPQPDGKKGFAYPGKIEQLRQALAAELGKVTFHDLQYQKPRAKKPADDPPVMQVMFEYDASSKRVRFLYGGNPVGFDKYITN